MKRIYLSFSVLLIVIMITSFQVLKTSLEITIRSSIGNTVEGVEVKLYKTYADFEKDENVIAEMQLTDKKGKVVFKELEPIIYYVSAVKGDINNFGDGEMVNTLIENRKNKVTIVIQ